MDLHCSICVCTWESGHWKWHSMKMYTYMYIYSVLTCTCTYTARQCVVYNYALSYIHVHCICTLTSSGSCLLWQRVHEAVEKEPWASTNFPPCTPATGRSVYMYMYVHGGGGAIWDFMAISLSIKHVELLYPSFIESWSLVWLHRAPTCTCTCT